MTRNYNLARSYVNDCKCGILCIYIYMLLSINCYYSCHYVLLPLLLIAIIIFVGIGGTIIIFMYTV